MKIAIVGAGVSGLSLYLFLEKLGITRNHSVRIFESRSTATEAEVEPKQDYSASYSATSIGTVIGLSTNGLKVLERLDPDLYHEVLNAGHILRRCNISNSRGWTLANVPIGAPSEIMLMIGRESFWNCLKKRIPVQAVLRRKVVEVVNNTEAARGRLIFRDSEFEEADLIIGADGIWSTVRKAILRAHPAQAYEPQYEGLVGVGGFIPSSRVVGVPAGKMNIVFGANGFFGYAFVQNSCNEEGDDGVAAWWSTYSMKTCPDDWRTIDPSLIRSHLHGRHATWKNRTIQHILSEAEVESLYPTFTTPLLPTWNDGSCVVIGDAAHALQPSSGQGASMALEDSETLALLLEHFLGEDPEQGHRTAIDHFSRVRMPRLEMVHRKAQEVGSMKEDMNFIQEMLMYFFIWLINFFGWNESYNRKLNEYNVPDEVQDHLAGRV